MKVTYVNASNSMSQGLIALLFLTFMQFFFSKTINMFDDVMVYSGFILLLFLFS